MNTQDFEASVGVQRDAIAARAPDVLVGSSFGGAVSLALLQRGGWRGPTLLLAPAVRFCKLSPELPERVAVLIAHGTRDTVVDIETSRALAKSGTPGLVELVEVDDEHRLEALVADDRLGDLVMRVAELAALSS